MVIKEKRAEYQRQDWQRTQAPAAVSNTQILSHELKRLTFNAGLLVPPCYKSGGKVGTRAITYVTRFGPVTVARGGNF